MCDVLKKSGVVSSDWLVIAKELKLTTQELTGAFLKAWEDSEYTKPECTKPSWQKLAKALRAIDGDWYQDASKQAEKNAGKLFVKNHE